MKFLLFRLIPYLFLFIVTVFVLGLFIYLIIWSTLTVLRLLGIGVGHEVGTFGEWIRSILEWMISKLPKKKEKEEEIVNEKPLTKNKK